MKAFFSSPAPNFKRWMTLCTLGVTLLVGLPLAAVAQDAVIPSTRGGSHDSHDSHRNHKKIFVNHTKWMVKYAESGRKGNYHPVPWVFSPNGTVRAGNLWQGVWHRKSKDTIRVVIRMNNSSATDRFDVQFTSSSEFTAYKNGRVYRYAVRKYR
ncbi:hypothetical protein ACE1B6_07625 [Aerosakkonemataceae cyanobacterium BLCC-F154]|uniref:Uncharacterized protein n=1 Tax=Floridaenema fluviatile BLCC-F154 TaxID=3153640 RepID=A0ABV4Y8K0_9CYAN